MLMLEPNFNLTILTQYFDRSKYLNNKKGYIKMIKSLKKFSFFLVSVALLIGLQ